jgi:hypothetical protein
LETRDNFTMVSLRIFQREMLIALLRELGVNYDPYSFYDDATESDAERELDPIDKATVGRINNKSLVRAAENMPRVMHSTMRLLLDGFVAIRIQHWPRSCRDVPQ